MWLQLPLVKTMPFEKHTVWGSRGRVSAEVGTLRDVPPAEQANGGLNGHWCPFPRPVRVLHALASPGTTAQGTGEGADATETTRGIPPKLCAGNSTWGKKDPETFPASNHAITYAAR